MRPTSAFYCLSSCSWRLSLVLLDFRLLPLLRQSNWFSSFPWFIASAVSSTGLFYFDFHHLSTAMMSFHDLPLHCFLEAHCYVSSYYHRCRPCLDWSAASSSVAACLLRGAHMEGYSCWKLMRMFGIRCRQEYSNLPGYMMALGFQYLNLDGLMCVEQIFRLLRACYLNSGVRQETSHSCCLSSFSTYNLNSNVKITH